MKMKAHFTHIDWDTDGEKVDSLPTEVTLDVDDEVVLAIEGADILSDKFGWCVNSFQFKVID